MRLLIVAMPNSIHVARWLEQIADQGWDVRLFPVYRAHPNPAVRNIGFYSPFFWRGKGVDSSVKYHYGESLNFYMDTFQRRTSGAPDGRFRQQALANAIHSFKPDIIHSLEIQNAGYLSLAVKEQSTLPFPTWIVTNYGSDIYLFGRLAEHRARVRKVLEQCDYYSCECTRDVHLAHELGLQGQVLPVLPNSGGFDIQALETLRGHALPSQRRVILLKGYQNWAGRALTGLHALARCGDLLRAGGYRVAIYSAGYDTRIAAELFQQQVGIPVEIIPQCTHEEMLAHYGSARIYIGLSISDAISTSLLESMAMGAFPIQSCTACADEWVEDGKSGFVVPPEDPDQIATAIRRALEDDALVNRAAALNAQVVKERLDRSVIQPQVVKLYNDVFAQRKETK